MNIEPARPEHWPEIWSIIRHVTAAGDTYGYPSDITEDQAESIWLFHPPGVTVVALDDTGAVLGTAKMGPNQMGPGSHVATASFMVGPGARGQGVGRALGEHAVDWARRQGYRAMQFNAVVETNTVAVDLWKSLGFEVVATIPEAFRHPSQGYVGLHVMYQRFTPAPR